MIAGISVVTGVALIAVGLVVLATLVAVLLPAWLVLSALVRRATGYLLRQWRRS